MLQKRHPNVSDKSDNVIKRIELLKEIISEYKEIYSLNSIEIITFLKTVMRIMRPLIFDKNALRLPWAKL